MTKVAGYDTRHSLHQRHEWPSTVANVRKPMPCKECLECELKLAEGDTKRTRHIFIVARVSILAYYDVVNKRKFLQSAKSVDLGVSGMKKTTVNHKV